MQSPHLLRRLREQADLVRQWEKFELGMRAPDPIDWAKLAELLEEAADRIVQLEQAR